MKYDFDKPASNEIWYTNGSVTEPTVPYKIDNGISLVSNLYDSGKKCWVIKFDRDVTSIGDTAFCRCTNLTNIIIPDSVTSLGAEVFWGCESLKSIVIPESVKSIRHLAFSGCVNLEKVVVPNGLVKIDSGTFSKCTNLTDVTIPNSVIEIDARAFEYCKNLKSIVIPESVTSIGYMAFYNNTSLTKIYCKPMTPPTVGTYKCYWDGFAYYKQGEYTINRKIYVHKDVVEEYKTAFGWRQYADNIVGC